MTLCESLRGNPYPGRGIVLGQSADGQNAVAAYFIMGRSENSRNRVFEAVGDDLFTRPFDESLVTDPSLIIYAPVRTLSPAVTVVTNGDQTDTVAAYINEGKSFQDALRSRECEPDAPHYTPRISGILFRAAQRKAFAYQLSLIKCEGGDPARQCRFFYEYTPAPGRAHLIHTYQTDGEVLPNFAGEPVPVAIPDRDIHAFAEELWQSLDADNRISLFVRYLPLDGGQAQTVILNRHKA